MISLRTERLLLRPFAADDAEAVLAIHQHEGLRRFVPSAVLDDLAAVPERLARYAQHDGHPVHGMVAIERVDDGEVVGMILLKPIPASEGVDVDDIEIGWRGHPDHGARGYVTEAARAALHHALASGLRRVVAVTDPDNLASQAVCRRIGMDDRGVTDDYYDEQGIRLFVADAPRVTLLGPEDEDDVLAFEMANRDFFAATVGDRGDAYFGTFADRHAALVAENESGESILCLVRDPSGELVGRVNIGPIIDGQALLGYRIAETAQGRGWATRAVALALRRAREGDVRHVVAEAAVTNTASRKVLERNGFRQVATAEPIHVGATAEPAMRYVLDLT